VASLVEFSFNNDKGLSMVHESSSLHFIGWENLSEEAIEVRCPPVGQMVRLYHWIFLELHDLRVGRS
jgi:hypothetical protein